MARLAGIVGALALLLALAGLAAPQRLAFLGGQQADAQAMALASAPPSAKPKPLPKPTPPPVAQVLRSGVLIVISKASQNMHVFKDGALWQVAPVSTGKQGHATPSGVFPILQKAVYHRSNLYSNAPMPFMQRLTWSGVAIHAGYLPGYPASHGCIRLNRAFARELYALTRPAATTVIITSMPVTSQAQARSIAYAAEAPRPSPSPLPAPQPAPTATPHIEPLPIDPAPIDPVPLQNPPETIQLTAAPSPAEAQAHWSRLVARHPELRRFSVSVIQADVRARRVYRLRASAPGAYAFCNALQRAGEACFNVR